MKGTRRSKVWLALGLVAMASLVLAGCPHNNLLDSSGTGGGAGNGGGSRGGNGEVKLIVTNFQSEAPVASKNASWLAGPSKSLAPDHIDLKASSADYVFVATADGLNGEKYGPVYITLDNSGITSLGIPDSGTWKITVSAYEATKLNGKANITGTGSQQIMAQTTDVNHVVAVADALVLRGEATLDLGVSSTGTVVVTLTNDKVEADGNVLVKVNFNGDDYTKINKTDYKVAFGLYDFATGSLVKDSGQGNAEEEVEGDQLVNPQVTGITDVPKGRYQFRVTVYETAGNKPVAYYADDITIEGNRDVTKEVNVPKLFDTPTEPTKAGVYWSEKDAGEARDGFLAYLSWEGVPYNAVGMDVQIADITQWYENGGGQDQVNFAGTGAQNINNANDLWQKIDDLVLAGGGNPAFADVVTELSWRDSPQKATKFPAIYKGGSLLNGESSIVLLMQTGHIYTVRVRASGATDTSDWVVVAQDKMPATAPKKLQNNLEDANIFNATKLANGLFDLVQLEYDLQGKYGLYKTPDGLAQGTAATAGDLVVYKPYGDAIEIALRYADMNTPKQDDWFLYPMGAGNNIDLRSKGWKGWKGVEDPTKEFNATVGQATTNWGSYSGHSNLTLVPVGAGAGFQMQSETADTFNTLDENNVLIDILATNGTPTFGKLVDGAANPTNGGTNVKTTDLGVAKDTDRYILNMDKAGTDVTWLFVSVGDDSAHPGTLDDQNGNEFTVVDIKATIVQNGLTVVKTFNTKDGHTAYAQLDGMASGNYTLRVEVKADSGYWVSYSTPLVIKYDTQTIAP